MKTKHGGSIIVISAFVLLLNGCASNKPAAAPLQSASIQFKGDTWLKNDPANFARARGVAAAMGATDCNGPISIFGDLGGFKKSTIIEIWTVSGCGKKKDLKVEITPGQGFDISENK